MRKKRFAAGLLLILLIFTISFLLFKASKSRTFQFFGGIVSEVETEQKVVALTFDDGPTPEYTDSILAVLAETDTKATFFLTGRELEQNPDEGVKIAAAGHELGNHSYSHERMVLKSVSTVSEEIERTDELIRKAGYEGEITFRPPFGKKLFVLPYYLRSVGKTTITWNMEPDSIYNNADDITESAINEVKPGSIILLHVMYPSRRDSLLSVSEIITELKEQGYQFVTVSELLALQQ